MTRKDRAGMSRRRFLKATAVGALAFGAAPTIIIPRRVHAYQPGGKIHPYIDPLRVVGARDAAMTTAAQPNSAWAQQEELVAWEAVEQNMDRMAMALAEEGSAVDAWKKIFLILPGKGAGDVVVGIKTNQIAQQRTRSAVMSKVCHVLTDVIGVRAENVYIYDACHGSGMAKNNPFQGLPEGVQMADQWGGSNLATTVPAPYWDGERRTRCLDHLVKGEVDILVDLALCKGHGHEFGGFTMSCKNHFGTFDPRPSHQEGGGADYLIGINKAPEILGEIDPQTGNVLFPRQQLCIVDALWASEPGPHGLSTAQPNALLMGTCTAALDYMGAMRLRRDMMGWSVNERLCARLLSEFGFSEADLPNEGQIIDALTAA